MLFQFSSSPEVVKEVERRMRVTDLVIKFITVRIDEKIKKIEKRKKQREKRATRKPAPAAPSVAPSRPAAPAAPVPADPAHLWRPDRRRAAEAPARGNARSRNRRRRRLKSWRNKRRKTHQRFAAAHRRRQGHRRQEAVFPAQEAVPVLRGEDRRHQLQGRAAAQLLHQRARQDHSAADFGRVRAASAAAGGSHQAGSQHRAGAVRPRG